MAAKATGNIFETLSNNDSSEDETLQVVKQRDPTQKRIRSKKNKQQVQAEPITTQAPVESKPEVNKQKHPNDEKKDKKVSADPHPNDKQSGTGRGKEMRKGGAGKANWGTYEDDLKQEQTENKDEVVVVEEEVDSSLTLSELLAQKNKRSVPQKQEQQQKKELDLKEFKKEKCEMIEKKSQINDLDHGGKKTTKVKENYNIVNNTENKDLLGIRTGLKAYSEKPRVEGEKEERPQREQRKPREQKEEKQEKQEQPQQQEQKGERREKKQYEKQGYQKPEERKSGIPAKTQVYKQKSSQAQTKSTIIIDDNSSFPTLG